MFKKSINQGLRSVILEISQNEKFKIDKNKLLEIYFNEKPTNMLLEKYQYQNYNLLKDCFNNLYVLIKDDNNNDTNKLDLIGYINDENEIIFDKLINKSKKIDIIKTKNNK